MHSAISVNNLSKEYRIPSVFPWRKSHRITALRKVSFTCPAERVTCLLGPNGAGKTTIIKILAGIVLPEEGDAVILEVSLADADLGFRSRIGLLTPNERSFYWRLTGRQNLDFFAALHGFKGKEKRKRVCEVLSEMGLESESEKPFRLYSSGMKQKLFLARALLGSPEILLLDEPTTHLDPIARDEIHRLIKEKLVKSSGVTVLICTHDLAEAQKLADHIVLLDQGMILAEGSLESLRRKLHSSYHIVLEFERMPKDNWLKGLNVLSSRQLDNKMEIAVNDLSAVPDIVDAAVLNKGRVARCMHQEKSLEDIFAEITGER